MIVCKGCKVEFPFAARTVKGEQVPLKNCDACRAKVTAKVIAHNQTAKGKASVARANKSIAGKERQKRYHETPKAAERSKRHFAVRCKRRAEDPGYKMSENIRTLASRVLATNWNSPMFADRTSFVCVEHFRQHIAIELTRLNPDFTMEGRGTLWEPDHKIPVEAYDFTDPVDIKRCWSPANIHCMTPHDNRSKRFKIVDALCNDVGTSYFPVAWNGRIPTDAEKQAFYAKCLAAYVAE